MGCFSSKHASDPSSDVVVGIEVRTVRADGFELANNFKFAYDPRTAIITSCIPGGLAEQNDLQNWRIRSFLFPSSFEEICTESGRFIDAVTNESNSRLRSLVDGALGKETAFQIGNEDHARALRELRPLILTFEQPTMTVARAFEGNRFAAEEASEMTEEAQMLAAIAASQREALGTTTLASAFEGSRLAAQGASQIDEEAQVLAAMAESQEWAELQHALEASRQDASMQQAPQANISAL